MPALPPVTMAVCSGGEPNFSSCVSGSALETDLAVIAWYLSVECSFSLCRAIMRKLQSVKDVFPHVVRELNCPDKVCFSSEAPKIHPACIVRQVRKGVLHGDVSSPARR